MIAEPRPAAALINTLRLTSSPAWLTLCVPGSSTRASPSAAAARASARLRKDRRCGAALGGCCSKPRCMPAWPPAACWRSLPAAAGAPSSGSWPAEAARGWPAPPGPSSSAAAASSMGSAGAGSPSQASWGSAGRTCDRGGRRAQHAASSGEGGAVRAGGGGGVRVGAGGAPQACTHAAALPTPHLQHAAIKGEEVALQRCSHGYGVLQGLPVRAPAPRVCWARRLRLERGCGPPPLPRPPRPDPAAEWANHLAPNLLWGLPSRRAPSWHLAQPSRHMPAVTASHADLQGCGSACTCQACGCEAGRSCGRPGRRHLCSARASMLGSPWVVRCAFGACGRPTAVRGPYTSAGRLGPINAAAARASPTAASPRSPTPCTSPRPLIPGRTRGKHPAALAAPGPRPAAHQRGARGRPARRPSGRRWARAAAAWR